MTKILKKTIVKLYNNGRTQASLMREYDISQSAISKWIKLYSSVEIDNGEILIVKQIKELQHDNACLESFFKQMKSEEIERLTIKSQ